MMMNLKKLVANSHPMITEREFQHYSARARREIDEVQRHMSRVAIAAWRAYENKN